MVSNMFYFPPYFWNFSNLTNIFQVGSTVETTNQYLISCLKRLWFLVWRNQLKDFLPWNWLWESWKKHHRFGWACGLPGNRESLANEISAVLGLVRICLRIFVMILFGICSNTRTLVCSLYIYLEPNWPLFLKVNPPKQCPFQSKQGPFGF